MSRVRVPVLPDIPRAYDYTIGVDESGTGALAGPFTVCAFMSHSDHVPALRAIGAKDSKVLTERRRYILRDKLAEVVELANIAEVAGDYLDQREAWRHGIIEAVEHCLRFLGDRTCSVSVQIDGAVDAQLARYFSRKWKLELDFVVHGDQKVVEISAASIFAKCRRTELMRELHEQYPMYGWANNDGYGTAAHLQAVEEHGICVLHRRVRPLLRFFKDHAENKARRSREAEGE